MAGLSFKEELQSEFRQFGKKASIVITRAGKLAFKTAVNATPVDTGNARAGWKLSRKRRSNYVPVYGPRKSKPAMPNFNFRITKDKRIYLYNNVPYASFLEHGEGPGKRIPHKMLAKAQLKFHHELRKGFGRL